MNQRMAQSRNDAIDQWLLALEQELADHGFPVVGVSGELVFEEVDEGALVVAFAEEVAPVVESDFAR